jgi:hypothetical protein
MIRPMPSVTGLRRLAAVAAVAAIAIGCGNTAVTVQPTESTESTGPGTAAPSLDATACPIETPPGPDDTVPEPGEIDTTDLGNGRWRLCLAEPVAFSVEGSAWCTWTADRTEVREAAGVPTPIGAAGSTVDGGIAIDRGEIYLASNDPRMISSWQGGPSDMSAQVGVAGRSGTAAFRIPAVTDPEHPPAVSPPAAAGVMSWLCGDPPPPAS